MARSTLETAQSPRRPHGRQRMPALLQLTLPPPPRPRRVAEPSDAPRGVCVIDVLGEEQE